MTVNQSRAQMKVQNSSFSSATNGAMGAGDRGAWQSVPSYTGNPYDSNDFVYRWRQYVHLYEISWEARKIIRIPVEDALRKDVILEDVPEEFISKINKKLNDLQVTTILKRSLMLERLLGGCLTFMGLEDDEDDASKQYHPHQGEKIRFLNAIPISRISRITWDTNPLSSGYMRPHKYLVNGQDVCTSRCLVWDGEPLFDPYDFALTNFRANLAGFGPSKLAPVWDDIVKAVGTRQAAYQLIQTNNAILAAVSDLQDLSGTTTGQKNLEKLKEIANSLSVYRAALIDGDKVDIKQHAASFGSVPELLMTFLQVLSAASDIPATRFIGQAPGGLNATGESDLENYYNMIDAYQQQRIVPQYRRLVDVIAYAEIGPQWKKERENLSIKFPPLWNETDKEKAETAQMKLANLMTLAEAGKISDEKFIEELNNQDIISVKLDADDIQILGDLEEGIVDPQAELAALKGAGKAHGQVPRNYPEPGNKPVEEPEGGKGMPRPISKGNEGAKLSEKPEQSVSGEGYLPAEREKSLTPRQQAHGTATDLYHQDKIPRLLNSFTEEFKIGMKEEMEHLHVVDQDDVPDEEQIAQIVMDHLREDPQYYTKLKKAGLMENRVRPTRTQHGRFWVEQDTEPESGSKGMWHVLDDDLRIVSISAGRGPWNAVFRTKGEAVAAAIAASKDDGFTKYANYKYKGIPIHIENPAGSERTGTDANGQEWTATLAANYGEILKADGADGDLLDVFVGPNPDSDLVWIIDQTNPDGSFDELKVLLGFDTLTEAKAAYQDSYADGKSGERIGHITEMTINQFKEWMNQESAPAMATGFMNKQLPPTSRRTK